VTLMMTAEERVAMAMLVMVGASAFDVESSVGSEVKRRFSSVFGVEIGDEVIAAVVEKVRASMTSGVDAVES
jgi:hypothetical protein